MLFVILYLLLQPLTFRRLEKLTEVQISAPIMWHIGPRLELSLAAFPPYPPPSFYSHL
jgi:hypothetical protein